jgi:hypothetical protein
MIRFLRTLFRDFEGAWRFGLRDLSSGTGIQKREYESVTDPLLIPGNSVEGGKLRDWAWVGFALGMGTVAGMSSCSFL